MRIGIDATSLPPKPGGAANYIVQLIHSLVKQESEADLTVIAQQHGYDIIDLPAAPGLEWVIIPDHPPAQRLVWEQTVLPRLTRKHQIDLLHSPHYTRPFFVPCKSIVTFHDMSFFLFPQLHTRSKRLFFPAAIRYSARRADGLIAISESTRQDAIRILGISPEKIITTHLGVSQKFRPIHDQTVLSEIRQRYQLPQDFFLYVGTVEPRKNLPLLINAYSQLKLEYPTSPELVVVGQMGWNYDQVFQLVKEHKLDNSIHFTGYVSANDLPVIYNLACVFIYPSSYEGFGLPPLEALATGTPVITTNISSMPEHVGEAGILVPPDNELALRDAMRLLSQDAEVRHKLSQMGPLQAAKFTWDRTAEETLQFYQVVMNRK
jgi:glycosyltransferase involved in cell wall biosynthesis